MPPRRSPTYFKRRGMRFASLTTEKGAWRSWRQRDGIVHNLGLEAVPILLCSGVLDLPSVAATVGTPSSLAKPFGLQNFLGLLEHALVEREPLRSPLPPRCS
jgi:hypothetical protein